MVSTVSAWPFELLRDVHPTRCPLSPCRLRHGKPRCSLYQPRSARRCGVGISSTLMSAIASPSPRAALHTPPRTSADHHNNKRSLERRGRTHRLLRAASSSRHRPGWCDHPEGNHGGQRLGADHRARTGSCRPQPRLGRVSIGLGQNPARCGRGASNA